MRRFLKKLTNTFRLTTTAHAPRRWSPQLEALEDRQLLSGFATNIHLPPTPIYDPIQAEYTSLGGAGGVLGSPASAEMATPYGGGRYERFQNGAIFYSPTTGVHDLYGKVAIEYFATAGETDYYGTPVQKVLGLPTSDEGSVPGIKGALMVNCQGGAIYWSGKASDIAHTVYGAIGAKYNSLGGAAVYGLPVENDEANLPGVPGVRVSYFQNGGAIYWSAVTGQAHAVYGAIETEYQTTATERDYYGRDVQALLGAPTSDEINVPGVPGAREVTFNNGAIYWSPSTGAHVMYGAIYDFYINDLGGPLDHYNNGNIGLPTQDERAMPGGRITYLQNGDDIIWTPKGGAAVQVPF
jgi:uncharacterized protein with LGFP repeats